MGKNSKHKVKTMPKRKVHSSNSSHPKKHETKHKVKHTETPKYETKHVSKNNNTGLWIAVFLLSILVVTAVATDGFKTLFDKKDTPATSTGGEYGTAKLEFYVMSQCPYGTQVEDAIGPVLDKLGDAVDFELNFISTDLGDGTFKSLHGEPETKGNIAQLCAIKYNPEKYMDMILCMNKDARAIPDNWESCANSNDLDVANIKTCYEGQEGIDLLKTNVPKAVEANARGSPTIFLNGNPYNSGRDTTAFLKAICAQLDGHPECINLPKCSADTDCIAEADKNGVCENPGEKDAKCTYTDPVAVAVKFLVDDNCVACQPEQVNDVTKNFFKGADFNEVKFESNEGQAMMEKYNIVYLPAYVFESEIENTLMWKTQPGLANSFIKNDDGSYRLNPEAVGSTWDPYQEVCDNEIDDNDDGKTDCEDEKCGGTMACMEKLEVPKVEMFVMSHCPFGTQFEKGAVPALKLLGDKIDYDMNFVYYAMHGKIELDEQLIQHCIQQEQKDIYLDYLECFLIDGNTDRCLSVVDIEKSDIQSCIDSTDEEFKITEQFNDKSTWLSGNYPLFDVSKDLNTKYNVGGSPSWVVNGVNIDSVGRDPASILKAICYGFDEKPAECDEVLPAVTYGSGFGPSDENVPAAPASTSGSCG